MHTSLTKLAGKGTSTTLTGGGDSQNTQSFTYIIIFFKDLNQIKYQLDFRSYTVYFFRTNFNAHFNMNMYVTLSSTCFGP